jgi:hypothetical protein
VVGTSFSCSFFQGDSSSVVGHDEVVEGEGYARLSTYLSDGAGEGFGIAEGLTAVAVAI